MINIHFTKFFLCRLLIAIAITPYLALNSYADTSKAFKFINKFEGKAWVIDGDSLRVTLNNHTKKEIRLFGIDAPEMSTDAGKTAKYKMIEIIKSGKNNVSCKVIAIDRYKRSVSICKNSNGDVAKQLLKSGWARVYKRYIKNAPTSFQQEYLSSEKIKNRYNQ